MSASLFLCDTLKPFPYFFFLFSLLKEQGRKGGRGKSHRLRRLQLKLLSPYQAASLGSCLGALCSTLSPSPTCPPTCPKINMERKSLKEHKHRFTCSL